MKINIHPAVETERFNVLKAAVPGAEWVNAATEAEAIEAIPGAHAFIGKISPSVLAKADRLRWVQSFTASLEHYMFPELVAHPCFLTNVRGLFGDVIADQVMGYVLMFARNLHSYVRRQVEHRYEPLGGEQARVNNAFGPGVVNDMDRATIYLPAATMGIVGLGGIGARDRARRSGTAFSDIEVQGVDRYPGAEAEAPEGVVAVEGLDRLPDLLAWSDFAVIAAPHTPETERLFDAKMIAHLRPTSYLINIGRGLRSSCPDDDLVDAALKSSGSPGAAARCLRGRATSRRSPALGHPRRDPHAAHGGVLAGDRRQAPGHARRERPPVRRG